MFTRTRVAQQGPARFSRMKSGLPHLALASFLFVAGIGFSSAQGGEPHFAVGEKFPALKLAPLTGETADLELAGLKDRVVLIHFWGTWCPPCVAEIPHIAAIEKELRGRPDFALLAISSPPFSFADPEILREETAAFLKENKLDLPTYTDVEDVTRSTFHKIAGWRGFPATMIIDQQGMIRGVWFGYQEADIAEMKQVLGGLLNLDKADPAVEETVVEEPAAEEAPADEAVAEETAAEAAVAKEATVPAE